MSHRKKRRNVNRHEPDDLLGVIAADERVRGFARWFVDEVNTGVRFFLSSTAFFSGLSAISPWTSNLWDRIFPFGFVSAGSLALFFLHLRYFE